MGGCDFGSACECIAGLATPEQDCGESLRVRHMSEQEINALLVQRFEALQTPWGRWKLTAYSRAKRLSWRCVIGSAKLVKRFVDIIFSSTALILLSPLF